MKSPNIKVVCQNKKARYDYEIIEVIEAGMVLLGTEVKSLRQGRANLKDSYARIREGELFLMQCHISPYTHAYYDNHEPDRVRKLLVHKREIKRLQGKTEEKGLTLVPLKIYFKDGKAKIELALARGKRSYDKRETLKRKTEERELERAIKDHR
jgi:SsrA-binding protein